MTDLNLLMGQLRDSSEEGSLLVIDGDAIAYMIGWFHRDHDDEELVKKAVDSWIREFFLLTTLNKNKMSNKSQGNQKTMERKAQEAHQIFLNSN